tara:strand:+ start:1431 stop:2198 length:768 start_codon:yes stop_codon:yes gene_type:complete
MKASIVIANYNNAKFINECINSLNSQTYNNIEIIFFDDNSKDNSIEVIEKYKNVKVVKNNVQTDFGSVNQINAFKKCIELSTGDVIFFLDSDDYFHKDKVKKIINQFLKDDTKKIIFDFPIILKDRKEIIYKKVNLFFKTYWGYIHPTSCISIRKEIANKIFETTLNDNFKNIWLDLRILLFSKYLLNYNVVNENLTYYRQTENNVSSKFKKYSKSWWKRRNEALDYYFYFMNRNNLKSEKNLDFYVTKIINKFI